MNDNYDKKIILACRDKYNKENDYDFLLRKNIVCYVVLKDLGENLLVVNLLYSDSYVFNKLILKSKEYPFLKRNSILGDYVTILPKTNVLYSSNESIFFDDFSKIMLSLWALKGAFMDKEVVPTFVSFCEEYYKSVIKKGSVITVKRENDFESYYVLEKNENNFTAIILHYDPNLGLIVSDQKVTLSYNNYFESIVYFDEYCENIENKIKKLNLI